MKYLSVLSLFILLSSCEFKIKEQEYDKGPGKPQEETSPVMSNPDISKDFLLGKFDYKKDERFQLVGSKWSDKEIYLQLQISNSGNTDVKWLKPLKKMV